MNSHKISEPHHFNHMMSWYHFVPWDRGPEAKFPPGKGQGPKGKVAAVLVTMGYHGLPGDFTLKQTNIINYGKSQFFMGKSTIKLVYQRVSMLVMIIIYHYSPQ